MTPEVWTGGTVAAVATVAFSVGIVTGMAMLAAIDAMGERSREVDALRPARDPDQLDMELAEMAEHPWGVN